MLTTEITLVGSVSIFLCVKFTCILSFKRETAIANLKQELEDEKANLLAEQEKLRAELSEKLAVQFGKEKAEFEIEIASKLKEKHSEEINSVTEQWKNKYAELKLKV